MAKKSSSPTGRSPAKIAADKRADEKRRDAPRITGSRLTIQQGKVMDKLYKKHGGSKKEAILDAADYYVKNKK